MRLPFTQEQFVDLFAAYNASVWPAVLVLWLASLAVSVMLLSRRRHDRWILALLAAHWMWSALGYHVAFFARINSAAWMFAALFLLQAALFVWVGGAPQSDENPHLRRAMPGYDLHGRNVVAGHAPLLAVGNDSDNLVGDRRLGGVWARRAHRLRPPRCGRGVGDLFSAQTQRRKAWGNQPR